MIMKMRYFRIDYKLKEFRDLKELYLQFNARNGGNPSQAQIELEELIEAYRKSRHEIFREFASLLEKYKSSIINSFIMVEKSVMEESMIADYQMDLLNLLTEKSKI